jgi:flagellar hook-associated protein 1
MSVLSIMSTGLSALQANQQALRAVSNNVANVNTQGYNRLEVAFTSTQSQGGLFGVQVDITRIANKFLAAAENRAAADVSSASALARFMDRAQGLLGDPSSNSSVFSSIDPVFSAFGAVSVDPASALRRSSALSELQTLLSRVGQTAGELQSLRDEAHAGVLSVVEEANSLLSGIARLNQSIQTAELGGSSSAEAKTEQQRMIDRLAEIMDIRVIDRSLGGVEVRTQDGLLLADLAAGRIGQMPMPDGEPYPALGIVQPRATAMTQLDSHVGGGEIKGLLRARDQELPNLQLAFGEFAAGLADAVNTAHNAASAVPAPSQLTGRNTGLTLGDAHGFTGATNIAVVDSDGLVIRNYRVDFTAGTITDDTGTVTQPTGATVQSLRDGLIAAMGANGTASFAQGSMRLSTGLAGAGVVIRDDPATPARRAGRGFSDAFGLNDLVTAPGPLNAATGLTLASPHGFTAGQTITFAVRNTDGAVTQKVNVTVPAAATLADLRNSINTALTGVGSFEIDANGRASLTPATSSIGRIDVLRDTTARGDTGVSFTKMFGVGEGYPAQRALGLGVRSDIVNDPARLGSALAEITGAVAGARALSPGDGRGALVLESASTTSRSFGTAGSLSAQTTSVNDYAARLAGHAGMRSEALESAKSASEAVRDEVKLRRQGEEGVNLDEELVKMTTYQQAYAAASRLIQAARDMFDVVINMV